MLIGSFQFDLLDDDIFHVLRAQGTHAKREISEISHRIKKSFKISNLHILSRCQNFCRDEILDVVDCSSLEAAPGQGSD